MCGIAGIIHDRVKDNPDTIKRMIQSLGHRGPDNAGHFFFNECVLGHARLKIIDFKTGDQPLLNREKNIAVVYNGEIYGYKSIRKKYSKQYNFKTSSDTEVLIALWRLYGHSMLNELPGMFAFAIWDERKKELFCARDRFGEKPFYYAIGKNGEFIFASEIKSILASELIEPIINKESIRHYLKRLYVHPHKTIYKNIHVLPPAHYAVYRKNKLIIKKYWKLPRENKIINAEEAIDRFKNLFENSVKNSLVSDVPVGIFLSGGLDSSTITAVASKFQSQITTISFGFGETINELPYAREIAKLYQTEHIELSSEKQDIAQLILEMQHVYDEPFADSSNIPLYLISRLAKDKVKVVLGGDGADELLAGYDFWYRDLYHFKKIISKFGTSRFFLKYLFKILQKYSYSRDRRQNQAYSLFNKYKNLIEAHGAQNIFFTDNEIANFGLGTYGNEEIYKKESNNFNDVLALDIENYLPGDILAKVDRASMANGLEVRSPFLDVDFASFCISLPESFKISKNSDKIILRKAYQALWPESIRSRPKQGFGAPVEEWLGLDSVRELKKEYLFNKSNKIFNLLCFDSCSSYFNKNNYNTWILLNLSIWLEKHSFSYK